MYFPKTGVKILKAGAPGTGGFMFPISPGAPGSGDFSDVRNLRSLVVEQFGVGLKKILRTIRVAHSLGCFNLPKV